MIVIINVINQPSFYQSVCERVHMKGTTLATERLILTNEDKLLEKYVEVKHDTD